MSTRTFWWDRRRPLDADVAELGAVVFDLDGAMAETERDGHRPAFNAAFAEHGLEINWDADEYGRLLRIGSGERRIAAALRHRGRSGRVDELAAAVHRTKTALLPEIMLRGDVLPRPGLTDLVLGLFVSGIRIAVVTTATQTWVEPLVRQLVGEGIVGTLVTGEDVDSGGSGVYRHALADLGLAPENVLAIEDSGAGLRAASAAGLATTVVRSAYAAGQSCTGAAEVRSAYDGALPLGADGCRRAHRRWWAARKRALISA